MTDERQLDPVREYEIALFRLAREGDHDAFAALQASLEPSIRRFVRRLIGGANDAEDDIVQTIFISLYRSMDRIDPPENLRPYVFRMARNRCYDELRGVGRYQNVSLDEEPVEMWVSYTTADQVPESEEVAHWLLLHLEVRDAMERLPELQRQALILYSEENMSYAEIAETMGTNIGTIKSRLFHAKRTLRALLRPETLKVLDQEFERSESISSEPETVPATLKTP
ncbi:RNA polymerase sigma factor [Kamptonema cortianum]|nr:RNA polymerase sigma factor [Kamptonema cortianum]